MDVQSLMADLPSITGALNLNVTELFQPGREWLNSKTTNFEVRNSSLVAELFSKLNPCIPHRSAAKSLLEVKKRSTQSS